MLPDKTPRHQYLLSGVLSWPDSPCLPSIPTHIPYTSAWEMIPKDTCYAWGFLSVRLSSGTWWTWFLHCLVSASPHLVFPCPRPFSNMLSLFLSFLLLFSPNLRTCLFLLLVISLLPSDLRAILLPQGGLPCSLSKVTLTCFPLSSSRTFTDIWFFLSNSRELRV